MNLNQPESRFAQVANYLRAAIYKGEYGPGDQLPSESALAKEFGLSRPSINRAMRELAAEGLVDLVHGRGTYVRVHRPVHHVSSAYTTSTGGGKRAVWSSELNRQGLKGSQKIRFVGPMDPPEVVATALGLDDGAQTITRQRLMLLEGEPVQLADSHFPADIAEGTELAATGLIPGGVIAALERLGHAPARFLEQVSARMPTADEVSLLHMGSGVPVLVHTRVTYDEGNRAVECDEHIMRADRHIMEYALPAAM